MNKIKWILFFFLFICFSVGAATKKSPVPADKQLESVKQLIKRVTPGISEKFKLELIPSADGKDVFELYSENGSIKLAGNNGVSLASAYNYYLREYCHCLYSLWGDQMNLPSVLPEVPTKVRKINERELRHFFNYCTFNYSGSWWDWEDWEKIIDYLAMNGVNMPLNIVGVESVWYHTLLEMGLTDVEARNFFAAPVYLNWQWMGNIEGAGGPLPKSWIDKREKLGRQIMEREQSLGMTPIVHGFSGMVPRIFKQKFPEADIGIKPGWGRESFLGTAMLNPLDDLFPKVANIYFKQLLKRIGTNHYYIVDLFHESRPPVEGDDYLRGVAKGVVKLLESIDPEYVWVMQDWSFWPTIIKSIDKDRLIIMSLNNKKCGTYKDWGYRFTVGQLNNFGGQTFIHGPLHRESGNEFAKMRAASENCVGLGMWMEDIESSPANYQMMLDMNWEAGAINLEEWFKDYSYARYGGTSEWIDKSNAEMMNSAYRRGGRNFSSMIAARPAVLVINSGPSGTLSIPGGLDKYVNAWKYLLKEKDRFADSEGYRYDVVDYARQTLSFLAQYYQRDIVIYLYRKDIENFRKAKNRFLELFDDMDRLLNTNRHFMFGKWIADARSWATSEKEADYYAKYAAILPTLWGQDNMECPRPNWYGYAWREWGGLVGNFYKYRWSYFWDEVEKELLKGNIYQDCARDKWGRPEFRGNEILSKLADWEWKFGENLPEMPSQPVGDAVKVSAELFEKYKSHLESLPAQGPQFDKLFKAATIDNVRTQLPVEENIRKVLSGEPYIK